MKLKFSDMLVCVITLLFFSNSLQFVSVNYLNYGPFSSYAPVFDSSAANLSKEESDLLLSAYGDESGVQYATRFVAHLCHIQWSLSEWPLSTEATLSNLAINLFHYYYQCIYFSLSPNATSLMWPQFLGK